MEKQTGAPQTFDLRLVEEVRGQEEDEGGIWKGTEERERYPR